MNFGEYVDANGVRLRYVKAGAGEPLVLLHTVRTQLDYFQGLLPSLAEAFEVYAPDLPGHGHSGKPAVDYTPEFS